MISLLGVILTIIVAVIIMSIFPDDREFVAVTFKFVGKVFMFTTLVFCVCGEWFYCGCFAIITLLCYTIYTVLYPIC
jgi:hypothetical protein